MTDSEQLKAILAEYPLLHDGGYGEKRVFGQKLTGYDSLWKK